MAVKTNARGAIHPCRSRWGMRRKRGRRRWKSWNRLSGGWTFRVGKCRRMRTGGEQFTAPPRPRQTRRTRRRRALATPAQEIRRPELGTLSVGAEADIAVLELLRGDFGFVDSGHARMTGDRRLQCALTVRAGKILWDRNGLSAPDWETAGEYVFA